MLKSLWTAAALSIAFCCDRVFCLRQCAAGRFWGTSRGIWKAAVPPKAMKGEFNNLDPLGVAAGARIAADRSLLNWTDPDDG